MSSLDVFEKYMDLPQELRWVILLRCDYRTLREYCRTSKVLRCEVKECGWFWELITRRDFGEFYEIESLSNGDWCDTYFHYMERTAMGLVGYSRVGNVDKVRSFLKVLPHPNLRVDDKNEILGGTTALIAASKRGHISIVQELLRNGADPDIASRYDDIALVGASERGYTKVVKLLLQYSAKVDIIGKYKRTALMVACYKGSLGVVRELLKVGANPNLQDENGETALMQSVWMGDVKIVQLLRDYGANSNLQDHDGVTAIDVSTRSTRANDEITKILLERVALNFDARVLKLEKS